MKIDILGVLIEKDYTIKNVLDQIKLSIDNSKKLFITTINPEMIMAAQKEPEFKEILNQSDLPLPDGFGIKCAAFFQIKRLKLIPGSDLVPKICELAQDNGYKLYLLGGGPYVAKMAAIKLQKKYPPLKIVGVEEGMTQDNFSFNNKKVIDKINQTGPDILFVAFGVPKEEKWIFYNLPQLTTVKIAMGVGGTFDFLAGIIKRAPLPFRLTGFEWLYRLIRQPRRFPRIITAVIRFPLRVLFKGKDYAKKQKSIE
jgi:N-acetylglucosaminyldiphosphoundecaprenol N-acetyl-beta-D-mannosaminyltransferase